MYSEIPIVEQIPDRQTQIEILLMFISEYGGWLQHLKDVGGAWGADGTETRAQKELIKAERHISTLRAKVLSLTKQRTFKKQIVINEQRRLFSEAI